MKTIATDKMILYDLEQQFQLQRVEDQSFSPEWQRDLPKLTETEQQRLQQVQAVVANLEGQ